MTTMEKTRELQIPEPLYACANCTEAVYPANMIAYVESKNSWYCEFCAPDEIDWRWSDDESEIIYSEETTYPKDKLPAPLYSCADDDCAAECSWPANELNLVESEGKFYCGNCPWYQTKEEEEMKEYDDLGPPTTLADVLAGKPAPTAPPAGSPPPSRSAGRRC